MKEQVQKQTSRRGNRFQGLLAAICAILMGGGILLSPSEAFAQNNNVSGVVSDISGRPLAGVSVVVKQNHTIGVSTSTTGEYAITAPAGSTLVFSFLGYQSQEFAIGSRTKIDVTLKEDALALDDVVVIGYGTQRKGDVTSAVVSVKADDFLTGNIGDAAQLVKGKIAGLSVTKGNGDPKSSSSIMLRGVASLLGSFTPLILVDGIEGSLDTVAPENIADISVLKDASAAAIYGTRGASGVILITTKTGQRNEDFSVSYSGYGSMSSFAKTADFMDASWIRRPDANQYTAFTDLGATTDWLKEVSQTALTQNHNVALEGGTKSMTYSANVSYRDNQGVIKGSFANDLRVQMDLTQYMFKDIFKININMLKTLSENDNQDSFVIYHQAVVRNPTAPIYTDTGDYYEQSSPLYYYNPVPFRKEHSGSYKVETTRLTGNFTLEPIKGWQTNLQLSTRRNNSVNEYYNTEKFQANRWSGVSGSGGKSQGDFREDLLELTSRYEHVWNDKHRFSALVGYSFMEQISSGFGASNANFSTNAYLYNNLANGADLKDGKAGMSSNKNGSNLIGFFGRISYGYDNRYNILVSLRREGSSRFGDANKWANFPAISAGWTISNEKFMKNTTTWLDNLKLRAGFGVTGVIIGSSYQSLLRYNYDTAYGNYLDADGVWKPALSPISNANPDLQWEKVSEINIGLDFSFFKGRLFGSADFYNKNTTKMLWNYDVPVPPNLFGQMTANVGEMRNRGVEVMLGGKPVQTKNVEWTTTVTLSHNKNTLLSMSNDLYQTNGYFDGGHCEEPTTMPTQRTFVGGSIGDFYMLKSVGVVESGPKKGLWQIEDPETGEAVKWESGMRDYDSKYRQYMGSSLPKLVFGWSNTVRFYGVDVTLQFSGQLGRKIFNNQRMFYENLNIGLNRYKSAADPVYGTTLAKSQEPVAVSYYLEKGDYMKLDNATIGYTFNTSKIKYIDKIRAYVSGENLVCLTGYSGLDPELAQSDIYSFGMDFRQKYPTLRTFSIGLNITFGGE